MISLTCTSCGGKLDFPENLDVAHCIYCGTKILITESETHKDQRKLNSLLDICKSALKANNYQEALDYCNKILEIDSKNLDAWIYKATSSFWLTTAANSRYAEAISYLDKAEQLDPGNPRIRETKEVISINQATWLITLGTEKRRNTVENFEIWNSEHTPQSLYLAREKTREDFITATNYYLHASYLVPDNIDVLGILAQSTKDLGWISWSDELKNKIQYYEHNIKRKQAEENLPKYQEALQKAEINLSKTKQEKGIFVGKKVKEAEDRVKQLKDYIAYLEKCKSSNDPKTG